MWQIKASLIVAALGILDTVQIISEEGGTCGPPRDFLGIPIDCGEVTTSAYGYFFGISVAYFGLAYYLTIFLAILLQPKLDLKNTDNLTMAVAFLPILGLLFSLYFVIVQLFVLELICLYCMGSAATSTLLFLLLTVSKLLIMRSA